MNKIANKRAHIHWADWTDSFHHGGPHSERKHNVDDRVWAAPRVKHRSTRPLGDVITIRLRSQQLLTASSWLSLKFLARSLTNSAVVKADHVRERSAEWEAALTGTRAGVSIDVRSTGRITRADSRCSPPRAVDAVTRPSVRRRCCCCRRCRRCFVPEPLSSERLNYSLVLIEVFCSHQFSWRSLQTLPRPTSSAIPSCPRSVASSWLWIIELDGKAHLCNF